MIERLLTNYKLKNILLGIFFLVLALSYVTSSYLMYDSNKTNLYKSIDTSLLQAAKLTNSFLDSDFHDRALQKDSITSLVDEKNIVALSIFVKNLDISYVYTMVQRDGEIYFTSSSATDEDVKEGELSKYFDKYKSATKVLKEVLKNDVVVYEESSDKWGTFRSVFIPMTTSNGNKYIVGADIQIDFIQKELDGIVYTTVVLVGIFFLILFILLILYTLIEKKEFQSIKEIKIALEQEIENKTQDIQELLDQFKVASDYALAGYWNMNLETNKIVFSDGWYEFLGYTKEDFKDIDSNMAIKTLVHPNDFEYVEKNIETLIADPTKEYNADFRILHKNGNYVWIKSVGKIYHNKFFGFNIDIDDLHNIRKLMLQQSKMAEMGMMLENISHQWRQPLNAISLASSTVFLENELGILTDEHLIQHMNVIEKNIQFLSTTIDTFRNFVNNEKEMQEIVIQNKIAEVVYILSGTLKHSHIEIINEIKELEPINIKLVEGELAQVLLNIINNAKEVLVERKIIRPWIKISLEKSEKQVTIMIEDNGGGIDDINISKIFEPYFITKYKSQGTGLGLHMSYKIIVESLKGNLYVKNTIHGAKFFIELPLNH